MRKVFRALGRVINRHPQRVLALVLIVVILTGVSAKGLQMETSQEIFVEKSSDAYKDYKDYENTFGGDQMFLLIPGTPEELASPDTLGSLLAAQETLEEIDGIDAILSLITFLRATAPDDDVLTPGFAEKTIFTADGTITPRLQQLFLQGHTIMAITLEGGLDLDEQMDLAEDIEQAIKATDLPEEAFAIGTPMLMNDMTSSMTGDMLTTGIVAAVLMVLVLYLVFPVRRRLLALPVVLVGVLVAFGTANLPGVKIPLTMITMGGLPVLIGLGADFSIQFQNRYEEEIRNKRHARAVIDTVARIGPSTLIAVIATSVGFSTLLLSQVPAVRDFSTLLIIGIISLFAAALFLLVPIIHLLDRRKNGNGSNDLDDENNGNLENEGTFVPDTASQHVTNGKEKTSKTGFVPQVSPAEGNGKPAVTPTTTTMLAQGTESDTTAKAQNQQSTEKDLGGFVVFLTKLSGWSIRHGVVIIGVSSLLAAAGFVADSNLTVQTELKKMIPSDTPAVEAFDRAREVMGSTEQLPIMLIADDVTSPEMMSWLTDFAERTVQNYPEILMSNSVLNLIPGEQIPNSEQFKALLQFMPEEISNSLITPDFKRTTITFALDEISATRMAEVLDSILKDANPPAGSSLAAGGAMTLMAQGASKFTEGREIQIILGLIGVFLVLLAVYQRIRRALIPVIPIALVTGWSSGVMYLLDMDLNPLTAMLGALIVGVGAEFSILLLARYAEEQSNGLSPEEAIQRAVGTVGAAISASALTSIGGFGALIASSFPAMRDFGFLTVINVSFALLATVIIVPPVTVWLERTRNRSSAKTPSQPATSQVKV